MRRFLIALAALFALASPALAQSPTTYLSNTPDRSKIFVDADHPLPVTGPAQNVTPNAQGVGGASACSGTLTTGGTAQQFIPPTTGQRGYIFQNQSNGPLYIRSKGAAGSLLATMDQNSVRIDAGAYYEPRVVSDYGYTLIGATTGQAFHCLYW